MKEGELITIVDRHKHFVMNGNSIKWLRNHLQRNVKLDVAKSMLCNPYISLCSDILVEVPGLKHSDNMEMYRNYKLQLHKEILEIILKKEIKNYYL